LALGLLKKPSIVVMDEPTNHLDIVSIEALEEALRAYDGALLLVSHDMRFLNAVTDEIWEF
jgi:ATPase subunit of ABC transporter with duplicated ATPase domains